jgi:hypothetical protein
MTHPILDYLSTGPQLGKVGYGIALWWPVTRTRYYSKHLWLARDRGETEHAWDYAPQAFEEVVRLGPLAAAAVLVARFIS